MRIDLWSFSLATDHFTLGTSIVPWYSVEDGSARGLGDVDRLSTANCHRAPLVEKRLSISSAKIHHQLKGRLDGDRRQEDTDEDAHLYARNVSRPLHRCW